MKLKHLSLLLLCLLPAALKAAQKIDPAQVANLSTFNVMSMPYGATGDGSTDDKAAIQRAIDAAGAAGGGIVFFPVPSVSYKVTGTIYLNSNYVILRGSGAGTLIATSSTTLPTISVTTASDPDAQINFWRIEDLHFNPLLGTSRSDTAPEIFVNYTREGTIRNCSFGQRTLEDSFDPPPPASEASRIGTCLKLSRERASAGSVTSATIKIENCKYYGAYRFLYAENTVDIFISQCEGDADRADAQYIYAHAVEALMIQDSDFVNTAGLSAGSTGIGMWLNGVTASTFTGTFFDTAAVPVKITVPAGEVSGALGFVNCWFSAGGTGTDGGTGLVIESATTGIVQGVALSNCTMMATVQSVAVRKTSSGSVTGITVENSRLTGSGSAVSVGANVSGWKMKDNYLYSNGYIGRGTGTLTSPELVINASAGVGDSKDNILVSGGVATRITDITR